MQTDVCPLCGKVLNKHFGSIMTMLYMHYQCRECTNVATPPIAKCYPWRWCGCTICGKAFPTGEEFVPAYRLAAHVLKYRHLGQNEHIAASLLGE